MAILVFHRYLSYNLLSARNATSNAGREGRMKRWRHGIRKNQETPIPHMPADAFDGRITFVSPPSFSARIALV
ncbi:MAG: hypothetical protein V4764_10280 [Burkholderia sp.]